MSVPMLVCTKSAPSPGPLLQVLISCDSSLNGANLCCIFGGLPQSCRVVQVACLEAGAITLCTCGCAQAAVSSAAAGPTFMLTSMPEDRHLGR